MGIEDIKRLFLTALLGLKEEDTELFDINLHGRPNPPNNNQTTSSNPTRGFDYSFDN